MWSSGYAVVMSSPGAPESNLDDYGHCTGVMLALACPVSDAVVAQARDIIAAQLHHYAMNWIRTALNGWATSTHLHHPPGDRGCARGRHRAPDDVMHHLWYFAARGETARFFPRFSIARSPTELLKASDQSKTGVGA